MSDKNADIARGLNEGNKIIVQMTRREFFYKIGLYFVIFALFLTIVVVLIVKLLKLFGLK